ncbi:hypothetical protein C8R43DRAFT_959883 [Mycena crocata]|nr:hypothetical protein C8R43DRAFT_959883 [Mycena crocata]
MPLASAKHLMAFFDNQLFFFWCRRQAYPIFIYNSSCLYPARWHAPAASQRVDFPRATQEQPRYQNLIFRRPANFIAALPSTAAIFKIPPAARHFADPKLLNPNSIFEHPASADLFRHLLYKIFFRGALGIILFGAIIDQYAFDAHISNFLSDRGTYPQAFCKKISAAGAVECVQFSSYAGLVPFKHGLLHSAPCHTSFKVKVRLKVAS